MMAAPLYEVFSSVQGEATHLGELHLFVRMAGCDLECAFCDTPASHRIPARCRVHGPDGSVSEEENPVPRPRLREIVARLEAEAGPHRAIALTGGEPLLFADFLAPLARGWREEGFSILLETGGHRPAELATLLDTVDWVMADIKIKSSSGESVADETVMQFLSLASRKECAVKVVVSAATTVEEVLRCARLVAATAPRSPLVLQPVSGARFSPPRGEQILKLQRAALRLHPLVRVIPQVHRSLHVR
ncbi:MAG: 7-carboxy-7-deazaguanine synthase QueE [Planctomycetaceae bacterium]